MFSVSYEIYIYLFCTPQRCTDLSYEEIYEDSPTNNPFCSAIMEIYDKLTELENSKECEELLSAVSRS